MQDHSDASAPPLWELVPLEEYERPRGLEASKVKRKWTALKLLFRTSRSGDQSRVEAEAELRALPEARLEHLLPPIDWMPAATALDEALQDWLDNELPRVPVGILVGQPYCGHALTLEAWASIQDARVIAPPDRQQILDGDLEWLDRWPAPDRLWALPRLEHCFLRHANGLELIRRLFEKVESGALGRGVIGCDSWAWAYLQHIWPAPQSSAKTLQAFDGARLTRFFAGLGSSARRLCFCNARTGKDVLPNQGGSQDLQADRQHDPAGALLDPGGRKPVDHRPAKDLE
jgi:hypothetical protein